MAHFIQIHWYIAKIIAIIKRVTFLDRGVFSLWLCFFKNFVGFDIAHS